MADTLDLSTSVLDFIFDSVRSSKTATQLIVTNKDVCKRVAFMFKDTNVLSFLVNPDSGIIRPTENQKIDIMMIAKPGEDISLIDAKINICFAELGTDESLHESLDLYMSRNIERVWIISLGVRVVERYKGALRKSFHDSETKSNTTVVGSDASKMDTSIGKILQTEPVGNFLTSSTKKDINDLESSRISKSIEGLLIEREDELAKLKARKRLLDEATDSPTVIGDIFADKSAEPFIKTEQWKYICLFFIGILTGIYLNSGYSEY